ncbi:MAG: Asp-tRNA(Asn)/Glu-tRNA(Gln) amidotransferase subunit GatA [Oscillospiraceae bacterium]|nr:Asp-tRNA(Asn)/Glu-tRNA(Gln) amidotransferase subunit GatA [Oscillospiraceae bacterium]
MNTLKQLRRSLDERQISVKELTVETLNRIKEQNPSLNAFVAVTEEEALQNADSAQKLIDSGEASALTGIPCAVKDNICTAGVKTANGSKMLENFVPFYDAQVVRDLKSQGAVIVGKTNMDEFAMGNSNRTSYFGNVRNPHDVNRVPGGSSGGSAAAVAAQMCAFTLGTDTGGSIRQPAAHCGISGLKPTYGRISRYGVTEFAGSFDTVGHFAKSAEDCGIILESLVGKTGEFTAKIGQSVKGLKIALVKELLTGEVEDDVRTAVMNAVTLLQKEGAVVSEVSVPSLIYAAPAYFCLASAEGVSALSRFDGVKYGLKGEGVTYDEQLRDSRTRGFGDEVKRRLMLGNFVLSGDNMNEYYRKSRAVRQGIVREFDSVFADCDVIISPTSMRTAFMLDELSDYVKIYKSTIYTVPMNLAGLPCASAPVAAGSLFAGVSVTGKKFDESTVLQVADFVEKGGLS